MVSRTIPQSYPRIDDEDSKEYGCLDTSQLLEHKYKITSDEISQITQNAIWKANQKSSRESIAVPANATENEIQRIYHQAGTDLFKYFKKYCGDPASTAHQIRHKHYRDVGAEEFRNRTVQKGRMNSGWRYQFLLLDCAIHSKRFKSVSDLGTAEADFNAEIEFIDHDKSPLSLYVSVKNRRNTMGGQDWPKQLER